MTEPTPDAPVIDEELAALHREVHAAEGETLLATQDLTVKFGGLVALDSVTFNIKRGEILGLIGPNGAGKTTCFNAITGVVKPTAGAIRFAGSKVVGRKRYKITRLGIARTFQNIRLFPEMSALENVLVGADARHKTSVVGALFRLYRLRVKESDLIAVTADGGPWRAVQSLRRTGQKVFGLSRHTLEERAAREKALDLMRLVGIEQRAGELARN